MFFHPGLLQAHSVRKAVVLWWCLLDARWLVEGSRPLLKLVSLGKPLALPEFSRNMSTISTGTSPTC